MNKNNHHLNYKRCSYVFFVYLLILYSSCSNDSNINTKNNITDNKNPEKAASVFPPDTVLITSPIKPCAKGCLPPNRTLIPVKSTNQTITRHNGEVIKLTPPETRETHFFSLMQNYNIDNGLSSDAVICSMLDKRGNLWLGYNGAGVSRYDGKVFTHFTTVNGLINNEIRSIAEDKNGNIWIGTFDGVSRYNGKMFANFNNVQGLVNNRVYVTMADSKGNIWFGTKGGISKFNSNSNTIYNRKLFTNYTTANGLLNDVITSIIEDRDGNLWFGTDGGGVSKFDGKSFTNYTHKEGLGNNVVRALYQDKNGIYWIGTTAGLSFYNPMTKGKDGEKLFTNFTTSNGLINNHVKKIIEDDSGFLWIVTDVGVSSFNSSIKEKGGLSFTNYNTHHGLPSNFVSCITKDRSDNLWLSTRGAGISRYEGKLFAHFTVNQGLPDNIVRSIIEDNKGNHWFGTSSGGFSKYKDGKLTNFNTEQGFANSSAAYSIIEDRKGRIWVGTYNGGVSCYDGKSFANFTTKQGLVHNVVLSIIEDKRGNLWFGTSGGGISCYDGNSFTNYTMEQGLVNNTILCITEDAKGNIWFGTYKGGVSCFDGKSFINYTTSQGLPSNIITSITQDKTGNLWFTSDDGIARFDGKTFKNYSLNDGLPDKFISQGIISKREFIAFGTNNGLSVLVGFLPIVSNKNNNVDILSVQNELTNQQLKNYRPVFETYNSSTGYPLKNINIGQNAMYEDSKGIIWIGTGADKTALVRFDYSALKKNITLPEVVIQGIKINNSTICWNNLNQQNLMQNKSNDPVLLLAKINEEVSALGKVLSEEERNIMRENYKNIQFDSVRNFYPIPENLVLPYELNNITFDFAAIEPAKPQLIRYQYKLENYDKEWSPPTSEATVTFGNISEGVYEFKLKAQKIGSDIYSTNKWTEPITYKFTVLPPWWRTWWMYIIYGIATIASVVFIVWWNGRRLRIRAKELREEVLKATSIIIEQKKVVEEKHREITDGINYAERIQRSLLASKKMLDENLRDYFIIFKPKAIVSGDFYWASKLDNNNFVLVTADSTGHGVPGAIMSILNIACLDKVVTKGIVYPDLILNETRRLVIEYLKNDGSEKGGRDGMDGSLLSFDFKNNKLYAASAYNPIWIIRASELIEMDVDRMPIGKGDKDEIPFTLQTFSLQEGDMIYTLTDGFPDQFGGEGGKKFKYKQLQILLLSIAHEEMEVQKQKLNEAFNNWKKNLEQVDDVCVIGVRV